MSAHALGVPRELRSEIDNELFERTILLVVAFTFLALTVVRWLIDKILPFIQAHTSWPGGVLGFIFTLTLAGAAFAEFAGIHAVFGAFITGPITLSDSLYTTPRVSTCVQYNGTPSSC